VLTVGSLFSGIGGLDLGLERAGMKVIWQVEIDPFCQKVLQKHFPDCQLYGDITKLDFTTLPKVDLICGGFPCQDVSFAGKRKGLNDGTRSGLWSHFFNAICGLRPRFVFIENVPGLLSLGGDRVLGDLASIGYDAEWETIPASAFGAPHLRFRVAIVAHTSSTCNDSNVGNGGIFDGREQKQDFGCSYWKQLELLDSKESPSKWQHKGYFSNPRPLLLRNDDGLSCGVDRLKSLGNAVVPQWAEWIGRQIVEFDND